MTIRRDGWSPCNDLLRHGNGTTDQTWILRGGDGGFGGSGGQGGKGGDGGKKGKCSIIINNKLFKLGQKLNAVDGMNGANGLSGNAGQGGLKGRSAVGTWHTGVNPDNGWNCWPQYSPRYIEPARVSSGNSPNEINTANWIAASNVKIQNLNQALLHYKIFLTRTVGKHGLISEKLNNFKEYFDNLSVKDLNTTTKDLLEESDTLEIYFRKHSKQIDFAPFYYSLLRRIQNFASNKSPEKTPQETKVLEYLYAATLANIARLNTAAESLLIIDIKQYLRNLIGGNFAELHRLEANHLRRHYQELYQGEFDGKIAEANLLLNALKKDINSQQQLIEPRISSLKAEINQKIHKSSNDLIDLQAKRAELVNKLRMKAFFGVFSLIIQGIGMLLPPAGPIVAGVANAGLNLAMNPSAETLKTFASKVVDMKDQLGELPLPAESKKHEVDLFTKVQGLAKTAEPLIRDVRELLHQQNADDAELREIDGKIANVNAYIGELTIYLDTVPNALENYLEGMVHEVVSFQDALKDKSLAALDFNRLEIQRFFIAMKQNIKLTVAQFGNIEVFEEIANKMMEAMDVSTNLSMRIHEYRDHIAFASYIAHLQSAEVERIAVGPEYQPALERLRLNLQQSIVQEAYGRVVAAIKQWSFPFAEKFLEAIPNFEANDYDTMSRNLPLLLNTLINYETNITKMDDAIKLTVFDGAFIQPFYSWSYSNYPEKIEALLKGEKVILTSDVTSMPLDAVKFNKIGIRLKCKLAAQQAELDRVLNNNYKVKLIHNGISYYKFLDNVYQFTSNKPIEIEYSFRNVGNKPGWRNNTWDKMDNGEIVLSPYTSWVIQLAKLPTAREQKDLLTQFQKSIGDLKVSLVGSGSCVDSKEMVKFPQMQRYYLQFANLGSLNELGPDNKSSIRMANYIAQMGLFALRANSRRNPQLNIIGLKYKKIDPDGNCLFSSVDEYVNRGQQALRNIAADYIENHQDLQGIEYLELRPGQTLQQYLQALRANAWGGRVEICALMRILNRPIVVITNIDNRAVFYNKRDCEAYRNEPIFIYYNGVDHYDSLQLTKGFENRGREILNGLLVQSKGPARSLLLAAPSVKESEKGKVVDNTQRRKLNA